MSGGVEAKEESKHLLSKGILNQQVSFAQLIEAPNKRMTGQQNSQANNNMLLVNNRLGTLMPADRISQNSLTNAQDYAFGIDDETAELLERFDKKIQPKIIKNIDKIDKQKESFIIMYEKNEKITV